MMFFLSLGGLVASGMLMKKYNDANDTTSNGYKYTIFSLVFFILAVLGTIIAGAFGMKSSSAPATATAAQVAAAPSPAANAGHVGKPITATVGEFVPS